MIETKRSGLRTRGAVRNDDFIAPVRFGAIERMVRSGKQTFVVITVLGGKGNTNACLSGDRDIALRGLSIDFLS